MPHDWQRIGRGPTSDLTSFLHCLGHLEQGHPPVHRHGPSPMGIMFSGTQRMPARRSSPRSRFFQGTLLGRREEVCRLQHLEAPFGFPFRTSFKRNSTYWPAMRGWESINCACSVSSMVVGHGSKVS